MASRRARGCHYSAGALHERCSDCGTGCRRWPVFPSGRRIASSAPVEPLGWIARIAYATGQPCENRRSTCLTPVAAAMREGDCTLYLRTVCTARPVASMALLMVAPFRGSVAPCGRCPIVRLSGRGTRDFGCPACFAQDWCGETSYRYSLLLGLSMRMGAAVDAPCVRGLVLRSRLPVPYMSG